MKVTNGLAYLFAAQENRYTFAHYYGNRRDDGASHVHRDFAQEGGFLCPSGERFRPFQVLHSRVGSLRYSQTLDQAKKVCQGQMLQLITDIGQMINSCVITALSKEDLQYPFRFSTLGQAPCLTHKHWTRLERSANDKCCSLLWTIINEMQEVL